MEKYTTLRVEVETKELIGRLKKLHRYKNVSILLNDMGLFFEDNGINPRSLKEPTAKQIAKFRDSLFKKLAVYEREYFKPQFQLFNSFTDYVMKEFGKINPNTASFIEEKTVESEVKSVEKEPSNTDSLQDKIAGVDWIIKQLKSNRKVENGYLLNEDDFIQLKSKFENILTYAS